MMRLVCGVMTAALLSLPTVAFAQNPLMASIKAQHETVKNYLLKTAELVPEDLYSYRPTPEVRSIAQLIGHVTDATINICGSAGGGKPTPLNAEKTMTTKAQLSKALADAMAVCDKVIASMDDATAMETMKFFLGGTSTRGMIIAFDTVHNMEHYGNLVTYMRMNKIVPPSSGGGGN